MTAVHAPEDLHIGDLVVQRMWSPTDPRWSSTIDERVAHGHRYGIDRTMRVAGITEHDLGRDDNWRAMTGFVGPLRPAVRWWLVDPKRPSDHSLMSWVESDWCELERVVEDGALW